MVAVVVVVVVAVVVAVAVGVVLMAMTDIKPRFDDDGVGWCVESCPHADAVGDMTACALIPGVQLYMYDEVCPVWAKRMVAWGERARLALDLARRSATEILLDDYPGVDGGDND